MNNLAALKSKWTFQLKMRNCILLILILMLLLEVADCRDPANIHAIIVSSSRYWFNYRHAMNALGIYEIYRQNGIPDENIILMIADEYVINARNPYKNRMHAEGIHRSGWYNNRTEIDYRGSDVTIQNFMDSLLGFAPKSLDNLNEESSLMIYVTGHGGDQFFKFQDEEELTAQDVANLMDKLFEEKKFRKALLIAETCQAFTMFDKITTPNVMALGTSLIDESAYSHHSDNDLGLSIIERWTYHFLEVYHKRSTPHTTLQQAMVDPFSNKNVLLARVGIKDDTSHHKFKDTKLSEFFGVKGGGPSKFVNSLKETDIVGFDPSILRKLSPRDASSTSAMPNLQRSHSENEHSSSIVCYAKDESNCVESTEHNVLIFVCGLMVTLGLLREFEKRFVMK